MVFVTTTGFVSKMSVRFRSNAKRDESKKTNSTTRLGILSFETAKIMSRLVSLYKSLSNDEMLNMRRSIMKSQGVAYLVSNDEGLLLNLACAQKLEDVDTIASAVARLGRKCSDFALSRFDLVYTDLKLGVIDLGKMEYGSKDTERRIEKMESLISATSSLYSALADFRELEISERKLNVWKNNNAAMQSQKMNFDHFDQKIAFLKKQIRHFTQISLWRKTFDKSVGLMASIVCIVYTRICILFGPYIPVLPPVSFRSSQLKDATSKTSKPHSVRFYTRKSLHFSPEDSRSVFNAAGPSTVGGSGLELRYANLIVLAERYLDSGVTISDNARECLYQMLPENLKILVRSKLSKNLRSMDDDESLAEGWRVALKAIMGWLAPMAHDTLKWQLERSFEKMRFDSKPSVWLLQTLHFSDKEKAEAAIAEVLVGLSCIYRYENRRLYEDYL
uniref:DUF3475 domain-containing protein n=1 Tax=Davidia involucrata TaxID=16924 RepID=A0A5B7ACN1_DAVIN